MYRDWCIGLGYSSGVKGLVKDIIHRYGVPVGCTVLMYISGVPALV